MSLARRSFARASLVAASSIALVAGRVASAGAAEGKPEAIQLGFDVEPTVASQCPDRARFVELLLAERPRLSIAPAGTPGRRFDIQIRVGAKGGLTGEVIVVDQAGAAHARSVTGRDCRTLVRALAVVTAVASDAVLELDEVPDTVEPAPAEVPPTSEAPAPARPRRRRTPTRPPAPAQRPSATILGGGLGTELVVGALPRAAMGYRGYVEARRAFGAFDGSLRGSLAFARAQLPDTLQLNVFVQIWSARIEGCASRRIFAPVSVEACAGVTSGAFHSYSAGIPGARDDVQPWLALGPGLRGRWHIGAFHAELFGSASYVPTVYTTVARDPSSASHVVPRVIGEIGLGIGHSFAVP